MGRNGSNWDDGTAAALAQRRNEGVAGRPTALLDLLGPRALQRQGHARPRADLSARGADRAFRVAAAGSATAVPPPDRHPGRAAVRDRHRRQRARSLLALVV